MSVPLLAATLLLALSAQEAPVVTAPPSLPPPAPAEAPPPSPERQPEAPPSPEPDAIDSLLGPPPEPPPAPASTPPSVAPAGEPPPPEPEPSAAPAGLPPELQGTSPRLPPAPQPYVPSTAPTEAPGQPGVPAAEISEDEAESGRREAAPALPSGPQPYLSLPGTPLFERPAVSAAPRPFVAPRSLAYEIPAVAEQLYESGVLGNARAAQLGRGPLDGGWTVVAADGRTLYRLQLSDDGSAVDGAWTDPNVPLGSRSGLVPPAFRVPGSAVTFRFAERPGQPPVALTLTPIGSAGLWRGELERAGERTSVTLQRQ